MVTGSYATSTTGLTDYERVLVNLAPTAELYKYLNLKTRVVTRMALVDVAATAKGNVLFADTEDSVTLSDFTLDAFRSALGAYLRENEKLLKSSLTVYMP